MRPRLRDESGDASHVAAVVEATTTPEWYRTPVPERET
jgi:hypothetical protein